VDADHKEALQQASASQYSKMPQQGDLWYPPPSPSHMVTDE